MADHKTTHKDRKQGWKTTDPAA